MDWASVTGSTSWNTPLLTPAAQLLDQRLEHLFECRLNQLGRGEDLRLSLQRQSAQIGFDVLVERQIEAAVDPGADRLDGVGGLRHFPLQPSLFGLGHLEKDRGDHVVLRLEMPVEGAGAQLCAVQDGRDAESSNSLFTQCFGGGGHDGAAHVGIGCQLAATPRTGAVMRRAPLNENSIFV